MNILNIKNTKSQKIKDYDETSRCIEYYSLDDVILTGRNNLYPNILLYSNKKIYNPYDEKVMSLNKESFYDDNLYFDKIITNQNNLINDYVYFFIYNFDNYYHFLYDTLPYLYHYQFLKIHHPNLKLLINYPNKNMINFYKFNIDILTKFVSIDDLLIHDQNNIYTKIFIGNSLTHGGLSNMKPRNEVYELFNNMITSTIFNNDIIDKYKNYRKIYISRRTWINNDVSNIGTNYTTRRKMMNEDELVKMLSEKGFIEIFTENLSIDEKMFIFNNAEIIIGSIGGGMANLLFSKPTTKSIIIVSPYFLDINYRFKFSLENTTFKYFNDTQIFYDNHKIPLYCRVSLIENNKIGEIIGYENDKFIINLSNNDIAGFNNNNLFISNSFYESEFKLLDNGLNSPYLVDINKLEV